MIQGEELAFDLTTIRAAAALERLAERLRSDKPL